jgi:flagellar basal-body rod protein FlgB
MLLESGYFGKTQYLIEKSMDVESSRRKVIADNMANADTPHFKRSEITFEANLRRALQTEEYVKSEAIPARRTDDRHLSFFEPVDYRSVKPRPHLDYLTTMRNDGNNVDPERETKDMLVNQLKYQALAQMYANNSRLIQMVMRAV